ncbi:MAG: hypothetical protein CM15mP49_16740 [Actinomycetota bacterium]|nr:MAG: hypothetical protein CM15mP49_16740 [Actinomycetota bacterium]
MYLKIDHYFRVNSSRKPKLGLRGKRSEQSAGYEAALDLLPALRPLMNRRAGLLSEGNSKCLQWQEL